MFRVLLLVALVAAASAASSPHAEFVLSQFKHDSSVKSSQLEDALLDVPGLLKKYEYPVEVHTVVTSDRYVLTVHRIPHGRDRNNQPDQRRPAVLLMHGLLSSSADYIILGPERALAYQLAEEGYDVWLGNARGNFYSRNHLKYNPDNQFSGFWKFSWDEIGNYDLPAIVDHILATTGQQKIHYVGHSQGGTAFLVLNSLRPEYNDKFISFQGLAPASFFNNNDHSMLNKLAPMESALESVAFAVGIAEVFGDRQFLDWLQSRICRFESLFSGLCNSVLLGGSSSYYNESLPVILGHVPAGASIRQFAHFGQGFSSNSFRRYNFNPLVNIARYGSRTPPRYDLSRITVPSYIFYTNNDVLVHPKDVGILIDSLSNVAGVHLVEEDDFDHVGFIWHSSAKSLVYDHVVEKMKEAEDL
ncbi:hypothetical protein ACJJTC_017571 [Scirpophaga incertulas]